MFNEVGILHFLLGFVLGHVCGSVPSGLWLVQAFHGIDIRNYGSKNIGTTNVFRTVGPKTAVLVLIADAFKGILAVGIMSYFFHNPLLDVITALGALLGHNYSLFLGFKGGKGVATALGLLIFMMPKVAVASFGIWLVCVLLTRYVSLGSIMAAYTAAGVVSGLSLCLCDFLAGCRFLCNFAPQGKYPSPAHRHRKQNQTGQCQGSAEIKYRFYADVGQRLHQLFSYIKAGFLSCLKNIIILQVF